MQSTQNKQTEKHQMRKIQNIMFDFLFTRWKSDSTKKKNQTINYSFEIFSVKKYKKKFISNKYHRKISIFICKIINNGHP